MTKFLLASLLAAALQANAADIRCPKPFSAKALDSSTPGEVTDLACQGQRTRMVPPGGDTVFIGELDTGRMVMVFPKARAFYEMHGNAEDTGAFDPCAEQKRLVKEDPAVACRKTGTGIVNGRKADRYETKGGALKAPVVTWFDPELHVIVKEQRGKDISELRDVKVGPPGVSFDVPAGYRKLTDQEFAARMQPKAPAPATPPPPKK